MSTPSYFGEDLSDNIIKICRTGNNLLLKLHGLQI